MPGHLRCGKILIAGTDPTNPNSILQLQASLPLVGDALVLSWPSVMGRTYHSEFKSALFGGDWQVLTNNLLRTGASLQVTDPLNSGGPRFYRLGVTKN